MDFNKTSTLVSSNSIIHLSKILNKIKVKNFYFRYTEKQDIYTHISNKDENRNIIIFIIFYIYGNYVSD